MPTTTKATHSALLTPACRMPNTMKNIPTADSTAPTRSKGRVGSAGSGSSRLRLSRTMMTTISAWKTNAARQSIHVAIAPPISGPAAAPKPAMPLITPNAHAREVVPVNQSVARM